MRVAIVHLTDLHITKYSPIWQDRLRCAGQAVEANCGAIDRVFLCVGGDVAYSGKAQEYREANKLLRSFSDQFKGKLEERYTPGNHDLDHDGCEDMSALKKFVLENRGDAFSQAAVLAPLLERQDEFFKFVSNRVSKTVRKGQDRLVQSESYKLENHVLTITDLNTAVLSERHEKPATLAGVDPSNIPLANDHHFNVLLCHHPLNWLEPVYARALRDHCKDNLSLLLCGHEHLDENLTVSTAATSYYSHDGGAFSQSNKTKSGFAFFVLDTSELEFESFEANWVNNHYEVKSVTTLPLTNLMGSAKRLRWQNDARKKYDIHEIPIHHPKLDTAPALTQLFEWPSLQVQQQRSSDEEPPEGQIASELLRPGNSQVNILWGSDRSGKTSVMRRLALQADDDQMLPVLIEGLQVTSKNLNLRSSLERAINEQYGYNRFDEFSQSRASRVLIIDNVECKPEHVDKLKDGLSELLPMFEKVVLSMPASNVVQSLMTSGELFENDVRTHIFQIRELNAKQKLSLVEQWVRLGKKEHARETTPDVDDLYEGLCEGLVLGHVPHFPFFILSTLSAVGNEGISEPFKLASYGYHFHILVNSFVYRVAQRVSTDTSLTSNESAVKTLLGGLAWYVYSNPLQSLREDDILEIFSDCKTKHGITVSPVEVLKAIEGERLLSLEDGVFTFRYSLALHYFVAFQLAKMLKRDSESAAALDAFRNLLRTAERRSSANIASIVFYLDPRESLQKILLEELTSEVDIEIKQLEEILEGVPSILALDAPLPHSSKPATKERQEIAAKRDGQRGETKQVLSDEKEGTEDETPSAKFFRGFNRRVSLLQLTGQLLRAATGDFLMGEKKVLVSAAVHVSIVHVDKFIEFLKMFTPKLRERFVALYGDSARSSELNELVDMMFGIVSFSMAFETVTRLGDAIAQPELKEVMRQMFEEEKLDTQRLALFSIELSSSRNVSISKLKSLRDQLKGSQNSTWAIYRSLVYRHSRLFVDDYKKRSQILAILNAAQDKKALLAPPLKKSSRKPY